MSSNIQSVPVTLPTLTRLGEVRPSDPRYIQPVSAVQHLANQASR